MSSHFNQLIVGQYDYFVEKRKINALKDVAEQDFKNFEWDVVCDDLTQYVEGRNVNWKNKAWEDVRFVYGVCNMSKVHWCAYEYDLKNKIINIYDSMWTSSRNERRALFDKHAALLPSLVNLYCANTDDKLPLDEPFKIHVHDCPLQKNGYDCGVYAIKFIQCLANGDTLGGLLPHKFPDFRRKILQDMLKWKVDGDDKEMVEEVEV